MRAASLILALGSLYALVAAGVVVVYRTSRVLNLAAGELAIVSGYLVVGFAAVAGGSILVGFGMAVVVAVLLGIVIYFALLRPVLGEPPFVGILITIGIAFLLRGAIVLGWGGEITAVPICGGGPLEIAGVDIARSDACTFGGSSLTYVGILVLYQSSGIGVRMRAVAENVTLAAQRGINVDRMVAAAWVVAMVAGVVAGTLYGSRSLLTAASAIIGLKGIVAALIGGLDSLKGAAAGGLIVAASEYYTTTMIDPRLADLTPIVLLLGVLLIRPWGIFGTIEEVERV